MQVSRERKVDWDDDDPYQIPDNHLPKHRGGELLSKDEELERKNNPSEIEIDRNVVNNCHQDEERNYDLEVGIQKDKKEFIEDDQEIETVDEQVIENKVDERLEESKFNDPLLGETNKTKEEPVGKDKYPSLYDISRQVDEEKQKNNPEELPKVEKKQKSREGQSACKKCVVQ